MVEIWKSAPGLASYEVSNLGRVRHAKTKRARRLKKTRSGYLVLTVSAYPKSNKNHSVSRLVCEAFNGPAPRPGMEVDHIDRIRTHNVPDNLRWVTRLENLANRRFLEGVSNHASKLTDDDVRAIRSLSFRRGQDGQIASQLGVSRETVRDVRLGKQWRHVQ